MVGEIKQILKPTDFEGLKKALAMGPEKTIEAIKKSGLTGRGGAGFPTGMKWSFAASAKSKKKYVICNADEGEPGTFKDKVIIREVPEKIVEGMAICGLAIGADEGYVYLRYEYSYLISEFEAAIEAAEAKIKELGFKFKVTLFMGAGAYVCGDETAIIESIEGKRGQPRYKPPFPASVGLFGKPTVINNVETLANVPSALVDKEWNNKLRLFSISGTVDKPGVYELPEGITLAEVEKLVEPWGPLKAVMMGAAGGIAPAKDLVFSQEYLQKQGASLGSCTVVLFDDAVNMVDIAENVNEFFVHESCGYCTPCREGNRQIRDILSDMEDESDIEMMLALIQNARDTSRCGLGQTCGCVIEGAIRHFPEDWEDELQ